MPRRRARAQEAAEELPAEPEQAQQQPESDAEDSELSELEGDAPEANEASQTGDNGDLQSLKFKEELSWRPAKPIPTGTLIPRLEKLSAELSDFDQGAVDLDSLKDVAEKLAHRHLLQHKDGGVKAYTACCLVDILRLYVPDAPFTSDQLKVGEGNLAHPTIVGHGLLKISFLISR
jgi:sister chromatid cohesion protein PDS5